MVKIFVICALVLIAGDFVCHGNTNELSAALTELAKYPRDPQKHQVAIKAIPVAAEDFEGKMTNLQKRPGRVPRRDAWIPLFEELTSVFTKMPHILDANIVINFSGAFLPLIDVLLNTVGTPPTLKAALQQEVKTYKDEKILHALGAYSSEVANIPAVKDEEVIQSIKYLFVVSARSEFRDRIRNKAVAFSKATIKILDALANTSHIEQFHITWPNVKATCDNLGQLFKLKDDDDYNSLCKVTCRYIELVYPTKSTTLTHEVKDRIIYLIKLVETLRGFWEPRRKLTWVARRIAYEKAPRVCLELHRPFDYFDAEYLTEENFLAFAKAELEDKTILPPNFVNDLDLITYNFFNRPTDVLKLQTQINAMFENIIAQYDNPKLKNRWEYNDYVKNAKESLQTLNEKGSR